LTVGAPEAFVALPSVLSGIYAVQVETSGKGSQGSVLVRF